jgi:hypothetical protein
MKSDKERCQYEPCFVWLSQCVYISEMGQKAKQDGEFFKMKMLRNISQKKLGLITKKKENKPIYKNTVQTAN